MILESRFDNLDSMFSRIPSSLKWLIDRYQNLTCQRLDVGNKIDLLKAEKESLDHQIEVLTKVISFHEVPIEATDIPVPRIWREKTHLPHGVVTKSIYEYLARIDPGHYASVTEILQYMLTKAEWNSCDDRQLADLREATRMRLKNLAREGKIDRSVRGSRATESRYYSLDFYLV